MSDSNETRNLISALLPRTMAKLAAWLLLIAVGAAMSGVAFFAYYQYRLARLEQKIDVFSEQQRKDFERRSREFSDLVTESKAEIERASRSGGSQTSEVSSLLKKVGPSIALIIGSDANGAPTSGTGFIVTSDADQSWIITNFHLVAGAAPTKGTVRVRLGDSERDGTIWSWDEGRDLALVILHVGSLPALEWASSETAVGSVVWTVGSAPGKLRAEASKGHLLDTSAEGLLADASVPASASGGPLLTAEGKVIGVLTDRYAPEGYAPGPGWAVPIRISCQRVLKCPG